MSQLYRLIGHEPEPEPDPIVWATWFEAADTERVVAQTEIGTRILVSTVFLGIDHSFGLEGPPVLFETMVFKDGDGEDQDRYATWDEAAKGHEAMVQRIKDECLSKDR